MPTKTQAIVLAAGKGKRLKCKDIPKVMFELEGKPMIAYSVENLKQAGFAKPVVVVGFQGQKVINYLKSKAIYVWQKKRLGTANAVAAAKNAVEKNIQTILVTNGDDSAFYSSQMIRKLIKEHLKNRADMTLLTVEVADPTGLGRIVKNDHGHVQAIVEEKLATAKIKKIKEINTGCFVFRSAFLWEDLNKVKKNPTGEYFLTDLVEIANARGAKVIAFKTDTEHWHGVNTLEQLEAARKHMKNKSKIKYQKSK